MFQAQQFVEVTLLPEELRLAATIRHSDGQHLLIALDAQDAALCRPGASIQLTQPIGEGLYVCDSSIVNRRDNLIVAKMGNPQLLQRRRTKRFDCDLPARYKMDVALAGLGEMSGDQMAVGRVRDISMGGAKLYAATQLSEQAALGLRIHISVKDKIEAEGNVVRCTLTDTPVQNADGGFPYAVAIRFGCVSRIHQVQLHRFLLQFS